MSFLDNCENVVVYTNGACFNNGRSNARTGYGVYFGPNNTLNISETLEGQQTNQR